ncbi:MAG: AAA ATPase [uncultured bacterium]|nr:MAG: AAA ATPase [uncultured bacterium]HLD45720.1 ATP-binding protein [bacterium]
MNPFRYGRVVNEEYFCPRPELIKTLHQNILSAQNVVVQGERRTGKTSLIWQACTSKKKSLILYADFLEVKTTEDVVRRLLNALATYEQQAGLFQKLFKALSHLKPQISIDPYSGEPSFSFDVSSKATPDSVEHILDLYATLSHRKPLVVVFDEFQDILNLVDHASLLACMRGKVQFHTKIPYIFSGSVRNRMEEIFTHQDSPFFKSALPLWVGAIDDDVFAHFLKNKFALEKRKIDSNLMTKIFQLSEHNPGDTQQLCSALWEITESGGVVSEDLLPEAMQVIFSREAKTYESLLVSITGIQLKCLVGLARFETLSPQSSEFVRNTGLSGPASAYKALLRLEQIKIVYRTPQGYKFSNPYFKQWLLFKKY